MEENTPICIRCLEDFPLAKEPARWQMGEMRQVTRLPGRFRRKLVEHDDDSYVCGNCYFDLTDEDDA